jgi:hypothetical protein
MEVSKVELVITSLIAKIIAIWIFLLGTISLYSQGCFEPTATKYQGGWHHNIMIRGDNSVVVWGDPTGMGGSVLSPKLVPNIVGIPIEVGAGTSGAFQAIRTTEKLYFYGGTSLWNTSPVLPGTSFRDVTDQLPEGVSISNIKRMVLSNSSIALITKSGDLYTKHLFHFSVYGGGLTTTPNRKNWIKASINNVEFFQSHNEGAIALTTQNQVYVWGKGIRPGDGNVNVTLTTPALVPSSFYGNEKALQIATISNNFYILTDKGFVWSWGNAGISLGRGGTVNSVPMMVLNSQGTQPLADIIKIDAANEVGVSCVGFLDDNNQAYNLGANGFCMLQGCANYSLPWTVVGPPFRDFVHGGHFTVGFKLNSCGPSGQYCYCGHKVAGSIGDGSGGSGGLSTYLCINSPSNFECLNAAYDYGDAPASYHQEGPGAGMNRTLRLGTNCKFSTGPTPVAPGEDNNGENGDGIEEDGLISEFPLVQEGDTAAFSLQVRVINQTFCDAYLYAWVDWNLDGKFSSEEAAEEIEIPHSPFPYTDYTVNFNSPGPLSSTGRTYVRFFLSKQQMIDDLSTLEIDERSISIATDGEVEDYSFIIVPLPTELPVFSMHPQGSNNCIGGSFTLSAGVTFESGVVTYQWKKDGQDILGANQANLVFDPVTMEDTGSYTCVVTNVVGSTESQPAFLFANNNAEFND